MLANVFNTTLAIHERFDLKGSSYKRTLGRLRGTPGLVCLYTWCLVLQAWFVSSCFYILLGASVVPRASCGVTAMTHEARRTTVTPHARS